MSQAAPAKKTFICDYCKTDPGPDPRNPYLWNGFLDAATGQHVCYNCRKKHYAEKELKIKNGEINNG